MFEWAKFWKSPESLAEATKSFDKKGESAISDKFIEKRSGEGVEDIIINSVSGFGKEGLKSFNSFYNSYINTTFQNERARIFHYRQMAEMPEIADVIEDATIESTQEDEEGNIIKLEILDADIEANENIVKNIKDEFETLFYNRIDINKQIWDLMRNYFIDGRLFYERIIHEGKKSEGIINIKRLPAETMDYVYDPKTGKIQAFFQYLKEGAKRPQTIEQGEQSPDIVVFYPEQIGFLNYGIFGASKYEILGFLEKAKQPFNQLKLLETSVIIYRLVRSPERLVFRIDTGNMPKDKAMAFVEKIKNKFTKKISYDSQTGQMSNDPEVFNILENFFLPQSADGRGSQIESIGGNPSGFAELDDIYYFARKLYRSLKYPMSRVSASQEKRESDVLFGGTSTGEITRDEIKWAKFLERNQSKFINDLTELFLLHLEFKGLKKEYELDKSKLHITMTAPNHYKQQMEQHFIETRMNNYTTLSNNPEFSKTFLMKKYLRWDDEVLKENSDGFEDDARYIPKDEGGF